MKLKTFLMSSAASLATFALANAVHAADAVVAEPEPQDYVRVCDMYGSGFYYIPGTETCLHIGDYLRTTYRYQTEVPVVGSTTGDVESKGTWDYRARVNLTTKNESEFGTVTGVIRIQGDGDGGADADAGIDRALITVGNDNLLRVGYSDQYWSTNHGYGTAGPINDAPSSFDQAVFLDYTFSMDGIAITVGIQDEVGVEVDDAGDPTAFGAEDPDLYAGVNVSGSWGTFAATVAHDSINDTNAGRVSLSLTVVEGLEIKGLYAAKFDEDELNHFVGGDNAEENWEYGIGINYQATEDINAYLAYYDSDADDAAGTVVGAN